MKPKSPQLRNQMNDASSTGPGTTASTGQPVGDEKAYSDSTKAAAAAANTGQDGAEDAVRVGDPTDSIK
jgi:hypothetical protein